jgi:hypothetical protein
MLASIKEAKGLIAEAADILQGVQVCFIRQSDPEF